MRGGDDEWLLGDGGAELVWDLGVDSGVGSAANGAWGKTGLEVPESGTSAGA